MAVEQKAKMLEQRLHTVYVNAIKKLSDYRRLAMQNGA